MIKDHANETTALKKGEAAPDFSLRDTDGQLYLLSHLTDDDQAVSRACGPLNNLDTKQRPISCTETLPLSLFPPKQWGEMG